MAQDPLSLPAVTSYYVVPTPSPAVAEPSEVRGLSSPSVTEAASTRPDGGELLNKIVEIRESMEGLEDLLEDSVRESGLETLLKPVNLPRHRLLNKNIA